MMIATTALIRGEVAAAGKKRGHTSWRSQDQSKRHASERRSDFRSQPSSGTEGPLVIEAEIGGHMIHRMYMDGGIFACLTEEKGPGPRACKSHPNGSKGTSRGRIPTLFQKSTGELNPSATTPLSLFWTLIKAITRYKWWSQTKKKQLSTPVRVYCYTKMPFGLKNAGATYQRLVDKDFDSQVGRNIAVYVDDLVIKSHTEAEMLRDIDETFRTLCKINMKLNLKKCMFGAVEGMFLGYMISPEGIKSCPDKTKVVLQLPSPWTIKECIKKSDFHWTPEAKQALKPMKQKLVRAKPCCRPKSKEELIVYLSASQGAISAALMTERGTVQTSVYLGCGGQILADFLVEKPDESPPDTPVVEIPQEPWTLFTDRSSCVDGSGADLILTSPEGTEFTYALRFQFTASNNEAFWEDSWKGNVPLKTLYSRIYAFEAEINISVAAKFVLPSFCSSLRRIPRGGVEQNQLSELLAILEGLVLPNMLDRWSWSLSGSGEFSVSSIRKLIDDHTLKAISSKTRWIKIVPIKINIHAWRVKLDNLPTRLNLSRRSMDLDSIFCLNCNLAVESTDHIFFQCSLVKEIYNKIAHWWDIDMFVMASYDEWWSWFSSLRLSVKLRTVLEGVFYITWSLVWIFRNNSIFGLNLPWCGNVVSCCDRKEMAVSDIRLKMMVLFRKDTVDMVFVLVKRFLVKERH
ncbi:reverse transcriptase domain-containing protein [Tanacetum coccineum]